MAARIPKRLAGPSQLTGASATLYTAPNPSSLPTGMVAKAIVKHIHLSNPNGTAYNVTLSIGADAAGTRILDAYVMAANTVLDLFPMYVLEAGELLKGFADTTLKVNITVDGEEVILGG